MLIYNTTGLAAVQETIADLQDPNRIKPYAQDAALAQVSAAGGAGVFPAVGGVVCQRPPAAPLPQGLVAALAALQTSNLDYCLQIGQSCECVPSPTSTHPKLG